MRRAFALAVLLVCAAFSFSQSPASPLSGSDVRRAASRAAADKAARALETGDAAGAREASEEARYLDPENADARYLLALTVVMTDRPLGEAEGELRTALAGLSFRRYAEEDAARLLAHVLVRTKRYAEVLGLVSRPGLAADPDALYLKTRALRFLGDAEGFLAAVDEGLDRFPSDARIPRELLEFAAQTPRTEAVASRVLRVENRLGYYRFLDPEILLRIAPFRASEEARKDALLEYRAQGGRNPRSAVLALEFGILGDAPAVKEFFGFDSLSWEDLRELRGALGSDEGRKAFAEAFAGYSGVLGNDANGDDRFETRTRVVRGQADSWSLDFDQDGVPEISLQFRDGLPESGRARTEGAELAFEYGEYPYLARTRYFAGETVREYLFSPDVLAFPVVEVYSGPDARAGGGFGPRRSGAPLPAETASAAAAYRVTERPAPGASSGDNSVRVTEMNRGVPVRGLVRTSDGRSGILVYSKGIPRYELADMDGDGLYESRYLFAEHGASPPPGGYAPYRFESDADLDGVFEYTEDLEFPYERTWDYDGDGLIDARATAIAGGGELREFSRRFDGRLDTAVVVRSGKVLRVLRAGGELPLVPDAGGAVLWVGPKPFDFGASLPAPGFGKRGAVRYRVVRFGDQVLAETAD